LLLRSPGLMPTPLACCGHGHLSQNSDHLGTRLRQLRRPLGSGGVGRGATQSPMLASRHHTIAHQQGQPRPLEAAVTRTLCFAVPRSALSENARGNTWSALAHERFFLSARSIVRAWISTRIAASRVPRARRHPRRGPACAPPATPRRPLHVVCGHPWDRASWQKATDALALELGTELVVGGPGHAEARCCLGDGSAVGAHTPYHFVANLHEVAAVEEVAAGEISSLTAAGGG